MTRDDIQALRTPLIALAVTVLLGAGVVLYSGGIEQDARRLLRERETQLGQARVRIQNAQGETEMTARYGDAYRRLTQIGFAGEEQRMNWLDGLRSANEQARISGVEYEIGAQRPYAHAAEFGSGPLALHESPMQLRLRLLHEEDLPRFFDALAQSDAGFFTVDRCVLRRLPAEDVERSTRLRQNVAAECDLRWLTARPATEKK
jgi:hypothetical protein